MGESLLQAAIGSLYVAATDSEEWVHALKRLCELVGGATAAVWIVDRGKVSEMISTLPEKARAEYHAYYQALDPWTAMVCRAPDTRAVAGEQPVSERELLRSELYIDFAIRYEVGHVVGAVLPLGESLTMGVAVERPRDAGAFVGGEQHSLAELLPHLQRAMQLRLKWLEQTRRNLVGYAALDALASGVVVVSPRCEIVFANAAAESFARADRGLRLGPGQNGIGATRASEERLLQKLIADVTSGGAGGAMQITRNADSAPLALLVCPLPMSYREPAKAGSALVLVVIKDSAAQPAARTADLLMNLYDLTQAEADVALRLASGCDVAALALARRVSIATVRTQVRQIIEKTGVRTIREFIARLANLTSHT